MITTIGFDADDTLWHNEDRFHAVQQQLHRLVTLYLQSKDGVDEKLLEAEHRNLETFGYGAKGFALSMIETAIELTGGRVTGGDIQEIIDLVKQMLLGPTRLLDGARETLLELAQSYRLLLITKGDLFEQETKVARSGLGELFHAVEIVSEKNRAAYERILDRHGVRADEFLMVGNSLRSDILPVLGLGATAVHIPYPITWVHEAVEVAPQGVVKLERLADLPAYLRG